MERSQTGENYKFCGDNPINMEIIHNYAVTNRGRRFAVAPASLVSFITIMCTALKNLNFAVPDTINQTVLIVDPAAPITLELAL